MLKVIIAFIFVAVTSCKGLGPASVLSEVNSSHLPGLVEWDSSFVLIENLDGSGPTKETPLKTEAERNKWTHRLHRDDVKNTLIKLKGASWNYNIRSYIEGKGVVGGGNVLTHLNQKFPSFPAFSSSSKSSIQLRDLLFILLKQHGASSAKMKLDTGIDINQNVIRRKVLITFLGSDGSEIDKVSAQANGLPSRRDSGEEYWMANVISDAILKNSEALKEKPDFPASGIIALQAKDFPNFAQRRQAVMIGFKDMEGYMWGEPSSSIIEKYKFNGKIVSDRGVMFATWEDADLCCKIIKGRLASKADIDRLKGNLTVAGKYLPAEVINKLRPDIHFMWTAIRSRSHSAYFAMFDLKSGQLPQEADYHHWGVRGRVVCVFDPN